MRNFKKILLRVLLIVAFLVVFNSAVRFVYEAPNNNLIYARKDLKESKGEIETLVLGTSLMHWGVDTETLGEVIDSTAFNLATSAQPLNGTYYLLKDQENVNPIERVFLGVHIPSMASNNNERTIAIGEGIFDRILSPQIKLSYMWNNAKLNEYEQYLFYAARVKNILTWDNAKRNVGYKLSEDYKDNKSPEGVSLIYYGMGNESTDTVYDGSFSAKKLQKESVWSRKRILPENEKYLKKIAEFCEEKGIELNLVITPMTWEYSKLMGDLEDMHDYFQEICDEYGAQLYDFYEYEGIYDVLTNDDYQDKKHLNRQGSIKFTNLLGEWYLERGGAQS